MLSIPLRRMSVGRSFCASLFAASFAALAPGGADRANAQGSAPIRLLVDASETPVSSIVHVHETVPASPGVLDLAYPRWVPGEHGPRGPIAGVTGLVVHAGSVSIPWSRDLADMNEFHIDVPSGATSVDVDFDFLGAGGGTYGENRLATQTILAINWNQFVLYPAKGDIANVIVQPTIVLPSAQWTAETALPDPHVDGNRVTYSPATLERLVDSPLDAGSVFKRFTLLDDGGFTNEIDAFADRPSQLELPAKSLEKFKAIVPEMDAIYGARHWQHYHFLLTISDVMPGNGVEHGSSSDDGTGGGGLTETRSIAGTAGLLSHEFNHSWDGKYRRPADLATSNFQVPEQTELLWIYEGMTQFYGDLVPVRAGFTTPSRFRDALAATWARLDHETGRNVRPLLDTAAAAPYLYEAPRALGNERRGSGDFYAEGELLWLDVDARLLAMSGGAKSLDGFCKTFFGMENTPSIVNPYTYEQFVAALNAYQAYDWDGYFKKAVYSVAPHPPSAFEKLGWKLVYTDSPSVDAGEGAARFGRGISEPFTLGINGGASGTLTDVFPNMPAAKGGLGFGDTLVAVNGREFSAQVLEDAIKASKTTTTPLVFIVKKEGNFRTVSVDYHDGAKYPHLVRVEGTPDLLATIVAPKRPGAPPPTSETKTTSDDSR